MIFLRANLLLAQVVADRAPQGGMRLLQLDPELYLLFSLLVQGTSILTNGASLAEGLYGLRRASARTGGQPSMASPSLRQLWLSIFFLVCLCVLRSVHAEPLQLQLDSCSCYVLEFHAGRGSIPGKLGFGRAICSCVFKPRRPCLRCDGPGAEQRNRDGICV